jgi:intracellular multiplication protein IcmC
MRSWYKILFVVLLIFVPFVDAYAAMGEDLAGILRNLQNNLPALYKLVIAVSYVAGIYFVADSVFRMKKVAQGRTMMSSHTSIARPLILFMVGIALIYFPTFIDYSIQSLWIYGSESVLKYPQEPGMWDSFINPVIDLIRLFGLIAITRGLIIFAGLGSENPRPGVVGKGLMHILGGVFAVNIVGTIDVLKGTFGF